MSKKKKPLSNENHRKTKSCFIFFATTTAVEQKEFLNVNRLPEIRDARRRADSGARVKYDIIRFFDPSGEGLNLPRQDVGGIENLRHADLTLVLVRRQTVGIVARHSKRVVSENDDLCLRQRSTESAASERHFFRNRIRAAALLTSTFDRVFVQIRARDRCNNNGVPRQDDENEELPPDDSISNRHRRKLSKTTISAAVVRSSLPSLHEFNSKREIK